jgi:hypothetical protein
LKDLILIVVALALSFLFGFAVNRHFASKNKTPEVTSSFLESRLADCSELTTCQLEYVDLVKYSQGSIPLMTKKSFSMIYQANIRAGVDLSLAKVTLTPSSIRIKLPQTEIQSITVNTDSLRFYDEHFALFNWSDKEDIALAIKAAREDVEKNADLERLKAQARRQAEAVILQLIKPTVKDDRQVIIE